jgi:hypothetical protein
MDTSGSAPNFRKQTGAIRPVPGGPGISAQRAYRAGKDPLGTMPAVQPPNGRWVRSAREDVWIRLDRSGQISDYRLDRALEPEDVLTLSEAAAFVRRSTQTLRNWAAKQPAFPGKKMGGHWVVIRPYLDAYLLHRDA